MTSSLLASSAMRRSSSPTLLRRLGAPAARTPAPRHARSGAIAVSSLLALSQPLRSLSSTTTTATTPPPPKPPTVFASTPASSAPVRPPLRHVLKITDLTASEIITILQAAEYCKKHPETYYHRLTHRTLLMLFEKPSLRTRLSFETGMTQLGGHAIYYPLDGNSNLGKKESVEDTAIVCARYADVVMARIKSRTLLREFAAHSTVPVINALDDFAHPCQILADLQTILEAVHTRWLTSAAPSPTAPHTVYVYSADQLRGRTLAFVGDIANNVTYDLMRAGALFGMHVRVAGPIHHGGEFVPESDVVNECQSLCSTSGSLRVLASPQDAVRDADIVVTDTWHSYHLGGSGVAGGGAAPPSRDHIFRPYQVDAALMRLARPHAIFMHCLPAMRGMEVDAAVIDGPQSVVFDEAENRMHAQKALLLFLLGKL